MKRTEKNVDSHPSVAMTTLISMSGYGTCILLLHPLWQLFCCFACMAQAAEGCELRVTWIALIKIRQEIFMS